MTWPPLRRRSAKSGDVPFFAGPKRPGLSLEIIPPEHRRTPMTDLAFHEAPTAVQTIPEPPSHRTTRAAPLPPIAPPLRTCLMHIGSDVLKQLAIKGKTPEQMAHDVGVDVDLVYQIIGGREADVSLRVLDAVAIYIGARFQPRMIMPGESAD